MFTGLETKLLDQLLSEMEERNYSLHSLHEYAAKVQPTDMRKPKMKPKE